MENIYERILKKYSIPSYKQSLSVNSKIGTVEDCDWYFYLIS